MHCDSLRVCALLHMLPWICRVALLFSARAPPASGRVPCAPRRCFNNNSLQGQTCAPSLHSLSPAIRQTGRPGESKGELSFAKPAFMSFLFPELHCSASGLDLRWMLLSSSPAYRLPLTQFYPSPCLSLPNHLSLFAYLHLPAHCYSLLLETPFLAHYIMFMWCAFHYFISVIRYRLPILLLLSHCAMIAPMLL